MAGVCRESGPGDRHTLRAGVVQMASTDDPRPAQVEPDSVATIGSGQDYTEVTHAEALASPVYRGALFAQWGRQKRRQILQQRYGDEFGDEEEDDLLQ